MGVIKQRQRGREKQTYKQTDIEIKDKQATCILPERQIESEIESTREKMIRPEKQKGQQVKVDFIYIYKDISLIHNYIQVRAHTYV